MADNILIKDLMDFGLGEKEAKVYLALLELGMAPAQEIAQAAGINRSSTYVVLEALKKKGFVSLAQDDKRQQYSATSPDILLRVAEDRADKQEKIKEKINNILPDLLAMRSEIKTKPKVRVFDGKEGLISALEEALEAKEKICRVFSSAENIMKVIPGYLLKWSVKRVALGMPFYGIYVDSKVARAMTALSPRLHKVVFVPKEHYPAPVDMMIYDDRVGYLIVEKEKITTIVLESKEISTTMKGMFDMVFEEAKKTIGKLEDKM